MPSTSKSTRISVFSGLAMDLMFSGGRHDGDRGSWMTSRAETSTFPAVSSTAYCLPRVPHFLSREQVIAMKTPSNAEFAQYRFVRDGKGNVVTLPCAGSEERILLVLDCERWGLARLHIFEEAAARNDKREAFEEEMQLLSGWECDSVSRLYSWGRDGGELFYADAMRDGEPLPDYLGRAGKVPVTVAARWVSTFIDCVSARETMPASMDRAHHLEFRGGPGSPWRGRSRLFGVHRLDPPGARVREHRWEWNLVQVLCSLVGGVPVRTFHPIHCLGTSRNCRRAARNRSCDPGRGRPGKTRCVARGLA